jgi:hypothetical protein
VHAYFHKTVDNNNVLFKSLLNSSSQSVTLREIAFDIDLMILPFKVLKPISNTLERTTLIVLSCNSSIVIFDKANSLSALILKISDRDMR